MNEAFQFGVPIFESLMLGHCKFLATEKNLKKEHSFEGTEVHFACGDYGIYGRKEQRGLSYEFEVSGTATTQSIIRWSLEVEFEYWSGKCFINFAAGFQGKYGFMPTRESISHEFKSVSQLNESMAELLDDLFKDIQADIERGTAEDLEEMKRFNADVSFNRK